MCSSLLRLTPGTLLLLAAVLLPGGCAWRRGPAVVEDTLASGLAAADDLWGRRAESGGLERATAAYEALVPQAATDRRLLVRLARAHWVAGLGLAGLTEALNEFEVGRGYADDCLLTLPAFADGLPVDGWRAGTGTVVSLDVDAAPCLAWAAANAYAIVARRGPGASLEVEVARALSDRAHVLAPDGEDGIVAWSAAMGVLLDTDPAHAAQRAVELPQAEANLRRSITIAPGNRFFEATLEEYFPGASSPRAVALPDALGEPAAESAQKWILESKGALQHPGSPRDQ